MRGTPGVANALVTVAAGLAILMSGSAVGAASRTESAQTVQVSVRKLVSTHPRYTASIQVPRLKWKLHPAVARRVNAAIEAWEQAQVRAFAAEVTAYARTSHHLPKSLPASDLTITEKTTLLTTRTVSLAFEIVPYYRGEAGPGEIPEGLTFSMTTGALIHLDTLFRRGTNANLVLSRIALAGLKAFRPASSHCYVGGRPSPADIRAWWLSPKGLVLAFPAGIYTAAYCGPATVTVGPETIGSLLAKGESAVL